ncbi:MAG TPA: apolipoprotein N-acyltransferase [Burkholderiales bacterium]|nr:apolipoprotein N-acyltransferase [Burkholderiales bacterium]
MKRGSALRERLDLVPLSPGLGRLFLSALLGAASVLGFAPLYIFPVPVATLAGLAWLWQRSQSAGQALVLGVGFGLGYFLTGTSWVYVSMHDFGGMAWPVAGFATLFFCSYLALFPAAAGWTFARLRAPPWVRLAIVFPAAWALSEWARGWLFTGFPWLAVGYSQSPDGPLSGFAALLGVYGVSLLAALSAGLWVWLSGVLAGRRGEATPGRVRAGLSHPALVLFVLLWFAGWVLQRVPWTAATGEPVTVSLVQGNIEQDLKWRPESARAALETYLELTLRTHGRLVVLPETALPVFNVDLPAGYIEALARPARDRGGDLLTGIPEYEQADPPRYYNSVMSFGTRSTQVYRKYHLVPFGDYVPHWGFLTWIMHTLRIPMSDFSRGAPYQRPLDVAGQRVAVNICYEDAFGEEIIRQLPEATLLANFTNDAWWGKSAASDQHLQIAQMRSQETGRYMLRATNTGVTAVIDHRGRIVSAVPQFVVAVLEGRAEGRGGNTPYIRWGNWAFLALAAAGLLVPLLSSRVRQRVA